VGKEVPYKDLVEHYIGWIIVRREHSNGICAAEPMSLANLSVRPPLVRIGESHEETVWIQRL